MNSSTLQVLISHLLGIYEVLEVVLLENGSHKYKKVGEIQPIEGQIWDNRFMATEEGAVGSNLNYFGLKLGYEF